jgi:outer membrane protein
MKRTTLTTLIIILTASTTYFWYNILNSDDEIAYIELNILLSEYQGMKDARSEFEKRSKTMRANVDTLLLEWEGELKAYEKERKNMSEKENELKQELLRNKQQQINNYSEAIEKKITEEDQVSSQNVINVINEFIMEYGKESGYKFVLGANGTGNVLYADEAINLTKEVLDKLNKEYNKDNGVN